MVYALGKNIQGKGDEACCVGGYDFKWNINLKYGI